MSWRRVLGGPPCRTTSRLRRRAPGPRPLRGRDGIWRTLQLLKTDLDSVLALKQLCGSWRLFGMESPEDPMHYMPEQATKFLELERSPGYG